MYKDILDIEELFKGFTVTPSDFDPVYIEALKTSPKTQQFQEFSDPLPVDMNTLIVSDNFLKLQKVESQNPFKIIHESPRPKFLEEPNKHSFFDDDQLSSCSTAIGGYSNAGSPTPAKNKAKRSLERSYGSQEEPQVPKQKLLFHNNQGGFPKSPAGDDWLEPAQRKPVKAAGKRAKVNKMKLAPKLPGCVYAKVKKDLQRHLESAMKVDFDPTSCQYLHTVLNEERGRVDMTDFANFMTGKKHIEGNRNIYHGVVRKCVNGFLSENGENEFNQWLKKTTKMSTEIRQLLLTCKVFDF